MNLETKQLLTVWHGTPHDFDQFMDKAINSGEGAQVYGHGHYVAEQRSIAKWYRDSVTKKHNRSHAQGPTINGHVVADLVKTIDSLKDQERVVKEFEEDYDQNLARGKGPDDFWETLRFGRNKMKDVFVLLTDLKSSIKKYQGELAFMVDKMGLHDLNLEQLEELGALADTARAQRKTLKEQWEKEREFHDSNAKYGSSPTAIAGSSEAVKLLDSISHHVQRSEEGNKKTGKLYQLSLDLPEDETLDWDEEFPNQHPTVQEKLRNAYENLYGEQQGFDDDWRHTPGSEMYQAITDELKPAGSSGQPAATLHLMDHGINGIRYRDASSRQDNPTEVYFDGKLVPDKDPNWNAPAGHGHPSHPEHEKWDKAWQEYTKTDNFLSHWTAQTLKHRGHVMDLHGIIALANDYRNDYDSYEGSQESRENLHGWKLERSDWLHENAHRFDFKKARPQYNYVVFDPNRLKHVKKFGDRDELLHDYRVDGKSSSKRAQKAEA